MKDSRCIVRVELDHSEVVDVRRSVCSGLSENEVEGRLYCTFHNPQPDKASNTSYSSDLKIRLLSGNNDFRYICVPNTADFFEKEFTSVANFDNAKFTCVANFTNTKFSQMVTFKNASFCNSVLFNSTEFYRADFTNAIFEKLASFRFAALGIVNLNNVTFRGEADFLSTRFTEVNFSKSQFLGLADFSKSRFRMHMGVGSVLFSDAEFHEEANFRNSRFYSPSQFNKAKFRGKTYFSRARFTGRFEATFKHAQFMSDAIFERTWFIGRISFNSAVFGPESDIIFRQGLFGRSLDLRYCTAEGYLRFIQLKFGKACVVDLQEAAFEKASRVSFYDAALRPNWFVNVDARNIVFQNVVWPGSKNEETLIQLEVAQMEKRGITDHSLRLLCIAGRQIAENSERANNLEMASKFRRIAFEVERLERKEKQRSWLSEELLCFEAPVRILQKFRSAPFDVPHGLYRWMSFYGESWLRASLLLVLLWLGCGLFYWLLGAFVGRILTFSEAIGFSTSIMLLQKSEIQTASIPTFTLRSLQTLLTPILAALLALALRRRFMR